MFQLNPKAVAYGLIAYPILYVAYVIFLNVVIPDQPGSHRDWISAMFSIASWFGLLLPGYFSGRIARDRGMLHGFVVGVLAGTISAALFALILSEHWLGESPVLNVVYYMAYMIFTAAVGGGLGQLHAKFRLAA